MDAEDPLDIVHFQKKIAKVIFYAPFEHRGKNNSFSGGKISTLPYMHLPLK